MNHKCDHALKYYYQNKKVKRDHNQTIKTLLLIEDLFSSAGKNRHPCEMDSILA